MASKVKEEIKSRKIQRNSHEKRLLFWEQFISYNQGNNGLFKDKSPSKENWIGHGIGISGINVEVKVSNKNCSALIYINTGTKEKNKLAFDFLESNKKKIETKFEGPLNWYRRDELVTSIIDYSLEGESYFIEDNWPTINEFLIVHSNKLENAIRPLIAELAQKLKG